MPTGYTACVQSGEVTEFSEFAMRCARAFGACITMRDDPTDTPIPEQFESSTYHRDRLEADKRRLAEFKEMSPDQRLAMYESERSEKLATAERYIAEANEQRTRYETMLAKVNSWVPPSEEHEDFAKFMREQLTRSIEFDCGAHYWREKAAEEISFDLWQTDRIKHLEHMVEYHADEWKKEQERTEGRNRWIRQLRAALTAPPKETDRERRLE